MGSKSNPNPVFLVGKKKYPYLKFFISLKKITLFFFFFFFDLNVFDILNTAHTIRASP